MDSNLYAPPPPPISSTNTAAAFAHLPFSTPTIAEVENHIVRASYSTPAVLPAAHHPPYADMICTAIAALNEINGSSRRAIDKYIEKVYTGLPATHSDLLTHNLKRLKNSGLLVMVKKSYKLAGSDATYAPTANDNDDPSEMQPRTAPPSRGRGRPPKNKTLQTQDPQLHQSQLHKHQQVQFQQPQLAQPEFQFSVANSHHQYVDPVLVALGLVDEPSIIEKKSPGMPRENLGPVDVTGLAGSVAIARRRGRPPGSRAKLWVPRRAGRPPKPKSVASISNGFKRSRGRPRKVQPSVFPFAPASVSSVAPASYEVPSAPVMPDGTAAPNIPIIPSPGVPVVPNANVPRSRGRPKKNPGDVVPVNVGYMRPKTSTGRPVGRPRKFPALGTSVTTTGELSKKLEYFQSKVKEAVGVLKPYFTDESPFAAANAFRELELLATTDLISAPSKDSTEKMQPLVPPPQLQSPPEYFPNPQHVPQSQPPLQQLSLQQVLSPPESKPQLPLQLLQQPTMHD